jgi:hypothetical protein
VQDPEAEHNVEALRGTVERERERVAAAVLHARTEQVGDCREALASLQLDPPARPHPRHVLLVVYGDHERRAEVLGEQRVEAVERADVEHPLAGERQRQERNARAMVARDARRVETVLAVERDRVEPSGTRSRARRAAAGAASMGRRSATARSACVTTGRACPPARPAH